MKVSSTPMKLASANPSASSDVSESSESLVPAAPSAPGSAGVVSVVRDRVPEAQQRRAAAVADPIAPVATPFVGWYAWHEPRFAKFLDFESLVLFADGTYQARVEATLVNPAVRSFKSPCTLPESGTWNAFRVGDRTKVRLRPTTGRARVYEGEADGEGVSLSRRGTLTRLFRERVSAIDFQATEGEGVRSARPEGRSNRDIVASAG